LWLQLLALLVQPVRTVAMTRGAGQTLETFWTGHWTLASP